MKMDVAAGALIAAAIVAGLFVIAGAIVWANRTIAVQANGKILVLDRFTGEITTCVLEINPTARTFSDVEKFACQVRP